MKAIAKPTPLREDTVYTQVTMVLMLVVNGVLPLLVLIVLNTKIYWAIKERMRRLASLTSRQKRKAKYLSGIHYTEKKLQLTECITYTILLTVNMPMD